MRSGDVSFALDEKREWRLVVLKHDEDSARIRLMLERDGVRKVDTTVRVAVDQPLVLAIGGRDRVMRLAYER